MDDAGFLDKIIYTQRREESGGSARRKNVVRSGKIVAERFTAVFTNKDGAGVEAIAIIKGPVDINSISSIEGDFSSRVRTPKIGDAIIWKNSNGKYAITKILNIKDDTRGDLSDELECEYVILK